MRKEVKIYIWFPPVTNSLHPPSLSIRWVSSLLRWRPNSKEEIKQYIEEHFRYDLNRTVDEIRPGYGFDETCQGSVPESIIAFLESESFEDAVRRAVSLDGDADTQGAIAGSIAEAFYGIPEDLKMQIRGKLPSDMMTVLLRFNKEKFPKSR